MGHVEGVVKKGSDLHLKCSPRVRNRSPNWPDALNLKP